MLSYLKAIVGGVGATAFPPIVQWLVSFTHAPPDVQTAFTILLVAVLTGGAVGVVPNKKT